MTAAAIAFVAVSVLRPWDTPSPALPPPSPPAGAVAAATVTPALSTPAAERPSFDSWRADLSAVVQDRNEWGVRAIAAHGDGREIAEVWERFTPEDENGPLRLGTGTAQVLGIGVTSPSADPPLRYRVWRIWRERHHFVPTEALSIPRRAGDILLPPADRTGDRLWQPGRYRLDILLATNVVRAEFELAGAPEPVLRVPRSGPSVPNEDIANTLGRLDMAGALAIHLSNLGTVTVACMDGSAGPPVDGATAWLDLQRQAAPDSSCTGAPPIDLPHALALLLPEGQAITRASLVRVEPSIGQLRAAALFAVPFAGSRVDAARLALFRGSEGGPWNAGTYRIDAEWHDGSAVHTGSWVLHLYPDIYRTPVL